MTTSKTLQLKTHLLWKVIFISRLKVFSTKGVRNTRTITLYYFIFFILIYLGYLFTECFQRSLNNQGNRLVFDHSLFFNKATTAMSRFSDCFFHNKTKLEPHCSTCHTECSKYTKFHKNPVANS